MVKRGDLAAGPAGATALEIRIDEMIADEKWTRVLARIEPILQADRTRKDPRATMAEKHLAKTMGLKTRGDAPGARRALEAARHTLSTTQDAPEATQGLRNPRPRPARSQPAS